MIMLSILENGLFALGQVLRFPVMTLLWVCVISVFFMAGACIIDLLARRRERNSFKLNIWMQEGQVLTADESRLPMLPLALRDLLHDVRTSHKQHTLANGGLANLVLEHEEKIRDSLRGSRALVKIGPSLGLIGTLIPMGTSLAAMAAGNLEAMASQMVVAFTTTIIGISVGTAAYIILVVRQTWVTETIREQRYLAEKIDAELEMDKN